MTLIKTILVCSQKGGVGKSTIADHIAWSLERTETPYNFYDLDQQGGVVHQTSETDNAEATVIDTPGALQPTLGEWISQADVIIIPTRLTRLDVMPLTRMFELVEHVKCPVILVENAWNRFLAADAFEEWLFSENLPANFTVMKLPQAEAIAQSAAYGESVEAIAPRSKAAAAMKELTNAIRDAIGLDKEEA